MAAKQLITFRFKAEYEKASKKDKGVVLDRMCEIPCERPPLRIRPHDHDHDNDSEPHPPLNKTPQSGVKPSGLRKTVSPLSRLRATNVSNRFPNVCPQDGFAAISLTCGTRLRESEVSSA